MSKNNPNTAGHRAGGVFLSGATGPRLNDWGARRAVEFISGLPAVRRPS